MSAPASTLYFAQDDEATTQHQDVYVHIFEENPEFRLILVDYKGEGESTNLLFVRQSEGTGSLIYWRGSYNSVQEAVTVAHNSIQLARDLIWRRDVASTN